MRFADKAVMIVGVASGLGAEAAKLFAQEGARLALVDRDPAGLETLAATLRAAGAEVLTTAGDAALAEVAEAAVGQAVGRWGAIDVLFSNVGIDPLTATTVVNTTEAQWDAVMAVNVKAGFLFSRAVLPYMAAYGGGAILFTGSVASLRPGRDEAAYNVSKAALLQLCRSIAIDHAADRVRANCICPGFLESVMTDRRAEMTEAMLADRADAAARLVPLGRQGTYAEVARLVLILCDDQLSGYITGAAITVDGGMLLS
jgi:NAD(P)-dependent dehydrogenase (short-subunit alcohol dehydrogenase family)